MHLEPAFRRWRYELEASLKEAETAGFEVPGLVCVHVQSRSFGRADPEFSYDELFTMYQREMDDTVIELETIISDYEKRGKPRKQPAWAWLRQNVPPHVWTRVVSVLVSVLFGAFVFGTWVGQTELYKQIMGAPNGPVRD